MPPLYIILSAPTLQDLEYKVNAACDQSQNSPGWYYSPIGGPIIEQRGTDTLYLQAITREKRIYDRDYYNMISY